MKDRDTQLIWEAADYPPGRNKPGRDNKAIPYDGDGEHEEGDKDSVPSETKYAPPEHRDGYDPTKQSTYGTGAVGPGRSTIEDAFWDALKRGDLEGAKHNNEILRTSASKPGLDQYEYEGWNGVSKGVDKGISEEILKAFFKPDTSDLDWSASYNYIMYGSGPGDDGAGAKGAMSRRV